MKSRKDIYQNEATEILRVLSEYRTVYLNQLIKLFPQKNETAIRNIVSVLAKQRRLHIDSTDELVSVDKRGLCDFNIGLIKCFWVMLDFKDKTSHHCTADYPVNILLFSDGEVYEIIHIPQGQENTIMRFLSVNSSDDKRILVVETADQIEDIDIPNTAGFCTVSPSGDIDYYTR